MVEEVNFLGHANFITVCVTGLPPDDPNRPGYAEIKDMAKKLASDVSKLTDRKPNADGIIPMAKVTDVYAEFTKLEFEDEKRFIGVLRAAVRLFPSTAMAQRLPGWFSWDSTPKMLEYRGRFAYCNRCKLNTNKVHSADSCPSESKKQCRVCGSTGHLQRDCPTRTTTTTTTTTDSTLSKLVPPPTTTQNTRTTDQQQGQQSSPPQRTLVHPLFALDRPGKRGADASDNDTGHDSKKR